MESEEVKALHVMSWEVTGNSTGSSLSFHYKSGLLKKKIVVCGPFLMDSF